MEMIFVFVALVAVITVCKFFPFLKVCQLVELFCSDEDEWLVSKNEPKTAEQRDFKMAA